ncbi:MAG: efflux RND transporter periplasmic adaptor subunit [Gemmatimonadaceae bacterium]
MMRRLDVARLLVAVLWAGCTRAPQEDSAAADAPVPGVQVAPVSIGSFTESVDAVGVAQARPGHVASLSAPSPTRVTRIFVSAGQPVRAGQPLVQLDQLPFQAAVQSAEAALAAAEQAEARATRLAQAGVLPRREAEQATAALAVARLDAVNTRQQAALSTLRSPIAGTVTRMSAVLGAGVDRGQALVEVSDPAAVDVVLSVSPDDAGRVRPGQGASLYPGAGADMSAAPMATARVADVGAVVDSASRGVVIRLQLSPGARLVRLGQTLFARVLVAEHPRALLVPDESLVPAGDGFHVFVVDAAGLAHARPVSIGGRSDRRAWITAGLAVTDRVVTRGAFGVDDSVRVEARRP